MEYAGALILLATLAVGTYCIIRTKIDLKRITVLIGLGFFVGVALYLSGRITGVRIPIIGGEITATAKKVRADATEVRELRKTD